MVLKIPFPLLRSPILRVMYVWRCVEQERRLQFSSGLFVVGTQCGSETLWIGDPLENLCDRSAFDFAP